MEQALLTRTVDFIYTSSSGIPLVEAGNFRALVKLDNRTLARLPNVPAISSELPELLGLSDRIYTIFEGSITGVLDKDDASQESLMKLMTSARKTA